MKINFSETKVCFDFLKLTSIYNLTLLIDQPQIILGRGQFGIVFKGTYDNEKVAIKTTQPTSDKTFLKALLSEIKVMIYLTKDDNETNKEYLTGKNNIVNLIGCNTKDLQRGKVVVDKQ